jgi:hypothetical protein
MASRPIDSIISRLARVFSAARKSDLEDLQHDLESINVEDDLWSGGGNARNNHRVPGQQQSPVGPNESMAGGSGTDKMIGHYSDPTARNSMDATAILGDMVGRQTRIEKAVTAISATLALLLKADLQDDESDEDAKKKRAGDLIDDEDFEEPRGRKPNAEASSKAAERDGISVPHFNIADAFSFLGPQTSARAEAAATAIQAQNERERNRSVAIPPSMIGNRALMKAAHEEIQDRIDAGGLTQAQIIDLQIRANARRMYSQGADINENDPRLRNINFNDGIIG